MVQVTFYAYTGYSFSDEPASDAVIDLNEHWAMPAAIVMHDPAHKTTAQIKVEMTDTDLQRVDYIKLSENGQRWYYFVANHQRVNAKVAVLNLVQDSFATVGMSNIGFFGNVTRRSLTPDEATRYALLPEPWAPRRPLLTRRVIVDLNVNKVARIPSHIALNFEETATVEEETAVIGVPNSVLGVTTTADSLSVDLDIPIGYPNPATGTDHTITTPWGEIEYTTPYENYYNLSGASLVTFLMKSKKYNALDLISPPYYLPSPGEIRNVIVPEFATPTTRNPKASKWYTTITIRSLASGQSRTFTDSDMDFTYQMPLAVMVVPDKMGGMYLLPMNLYGTGFNPYMYMEGVYSPFETITFNAVGDTPAKFAADGTNLVNIALNALFETYIGKVNALQMQGMQSKYLKDLASVRGAIMALGAEALGIVTEAITKTTGYDQRIDVNNTTQPYSQSTSGSTYQGPHSQSANGSTTGSGSSTTTTQRAGQRIETFTEYLSSNGNVVDMTSDSAYYTNTWGSPSNNYTDSHTSTTTNPGGGNTNSSTTSVGASNGTNSSTTTINPMTQSGYQIVHVPDQTTTTTTTQTATSRSIAEGVARVDSNVGNVYQSNAPNLSATPDRNTLQTLLFGSYRNEVHSFMLGNINDYLNRWASIQNDLHNGKVANLFKNVTLVGQYTDANKLAGKYEILITYLNPLDEANFDMFLDHFGHAVDEYSNQLVKDVGKNYTYTMIGEDAIVTNPVKQDANPVIANQFRTGVRVWKTLIRPENF